MLKELFTSIVDLSQRAVAPERPQILEETKSADGRTFSYVYGGKIQEFVKDPPPRKHAATNLPSLRLLIERGATAEAPLIFIDQDEVICILDDERRETVSMRLVASHHFQLLSALPRSFGQRDAIAFVRRELHGTGFDSYANALRSVVFERGQRSESRSQRDEESMGKSIDARVSGIGELPEFLRGRIEVFDPGIYLFSVPLEIGVDPRISDEVFDFWLAPDELAKCWMTAQGAIEAELQEALPNAIVVRGNP